VLHCIFVQTPNSPVAAGSSGGRKNSKRIILACQGTTQSSSEVYDFYRMCMCSLIYTIHCFVLQISLGGMGYVPLNMLGTIQVLHFISCIISLFPTQVELISGHILSVSEDCRTTSRSEGEQYYL